MVDYSKTVIEIALPLIFRSTLMTMCQNIDEADHINFHIVGSNRPLGTKLVDIFYGVPNSSIWMYSLSDPGTNGVPFFACNIHHVVAALKCIIRRIRSSREACK